MPRVSVIMPVYNAERFLSIALDSLIAQTLKDIEIICVDDGSTDASFEILQKYAEKDDRFILLQQKNMYAGVARNHGMRAARGKYLSFLDADDHFKPDMLEKAYQCAEREAVDVVVFGVNFFQNNLGDAHYRDGWLREDQMPGGDSFKPEDNLDFLFNFTGTAAWNKLFKREFIEKENLLFQEVKRWNDVYFVEMTLALANKIGIVREPLIDYRIENSNSLQGTRDESLLDSVKAFYKVHRELEERQLYEKLGKSFRNECLTHFMMTLRNSVSSKSFEELYNLFKAEGFEKFHLTSMKEKDFMNQNDYQEFCYIQEHTAFEYIFRKYLELKEKLKNI